MLAGLTTRKASVSSKALKKLRVLLQQTPHAAVCASAARKPWYQADDGTEQAGVTLCIQLRDKVAKLAQELLLAHGAAAADSCACCPRTPLRCCSYRRGRQRSS